MLDGSGDVYLGGGTCDLCRLNDDGSYDLDFRGGNWSDDVLDILVPDDGSHHVIAVGDFTEHNAVVVNRIRRVDEVGDPVPAFASGANFDGSANRIIEVGDGSGDFYVGGSFTTFNGMPFSGLVRIDSDGDLVAGFDIGSGFNGSVSAIATARDGSGDVYVGGDFDAFDGNAANAIVRLDGDGSHDAGFVTGSGFNAPFAGPEVFALHVDASNRVYVGGYFQEYDGVARVNLVRLAADGALDTGFDTGEAFPVIHAVRNGVRAISPVADASGDILIGGDFRSYDNQSVHHLARISPTGKLR